MVVFLLSALFCSLAAFVAGNVFKDLDEQRKHFGDIATDLLAIIDVLQSRVRDIEEERVIKLWKETMDTHGKSESGSRR